MEFLKQINPLINEMKVSSALRHRKIYINEDIDKDSVFECLYFLDRLVELDKKSNSKESIKIILSSFGGDVYSGLAILGKISKLKDMGYEIITVVSSMAMSMAAIILLMGSTRKSYKYSTIMLHSVSSGTFGDLKSQTEDIEETQRLWKLIKKIIIDNSKITEEQLDEIYKFKKDWYITPEEALELGVIDEIV